MSEISQPAVGTRIKVAYTIKSKNKSVAYALVISSLDKCKFLIAFANKYLQQANVNVILSR